MVSSRYHNFITEKMSRIIRRDTIIITHIAIAVVALLDIFKESEESWPQELKLISLAFLAAFSIVGLLRLRRSSNLNTKPIFTVWLITIMLFLTIVFLADFGSVYTFFALVPIFLASFYYGERPVYAIYAVIGLAVLLQPLVQDTIYGSISDISNVERFSFYNYALNLMSYILMVSISRLVIDSASVSIEDKIAIQTTSRENNIQRERLDQIVSNMNDAVLGLEKDGTVTFANSAAHTIFDTDTALEGRNVAGLGDLQDSDGTHFDVLYALRQAGKSMRKVLVLRYSDSDSITIEFIANSIETREHGRTGFVVIIRDVTEQVSNSEERHVYIALLSHELRTPLATLEAQLSNVAIMTKNKDIAGIEQASDKAHGLALRLNNIVNNLTKFVEIDDAKGALSMSKIDVDDLLSSVSKSYRRAAEKKGLQLTYENSLAVGEAVVVSHLEHLLDIIKIVADNAIKYTENGLVTINLSQKYDKLVISVTDTGIGISKHMQQSVFSASGQAEHYETRSDEGLGLGLYYAHRLAGLIDVELDLESELGQGSTFTISIPQSKLDQ